MTDPADLRDLAADFPTGSLIAGTLLAAADRIDQLTAEAAEADQHVSPRHWASFAEHAAIEAIDVNLTAARRRLRRHEQYIARLESLRAERAAAVSAPPA